MPSTTVHIPDDLLARVDRLAERRRVSRNRIVLDALSAELSRDSGEWTEAFFSPPADRRTLSLLRAATRELETAVAGSRRNRGAPLL